MFADGGAVHIVEVKPTARGQGFGSTLILAAVDALRKSGAKYVDAECTSQEGEALCRRHGFVDYLDLRNHRNEWDNPTLRLYLSTWRPPADAARVGKSQRSPRGHGASRRMRIIETSSEPRGHALMAFARPTLTGLVWHRWR
jgi:predicted GNAT family acetyltransferase